MTPPADNNPTPWRDDRDRMQQLLVELLNSLPPDAVTGFLDNIAPALERMWAPRVLEQGVDVTRLNSGQQVWAGPSRFNIFNFLDAASPAATWLGGNVDINTGAASRTLSTLSAFPTAKMLLVCIFTGNNAVIDTSASGVTYNGVAMTQLAETNIVDAGEQLYGEIWYMANPPCEAAHNVVATFTNVGRTCDIGIGIYTGSTSAPTVQTRSGIKATAPSMVVSNVGETGMIEWAFGQRSAIGSSPTVQVLASANPTTTDFDSGVGGEAQLVQRRSTGNASVAGQVSTTSAGSSTGMPWILFGVSMPYGAGGGFALAVDDFARNQVNIRSVPPTSTAGGLMNADYVVDSTGNGTHLTLFGASGALEAAIATGANRFIWVCATHTETRTTTHNMGVLAASQRIMVMSGSPYRANITFDFSGAGITVAGSFPGSLSRVQFEDIQFTSANGRTVDFLTANGVRQPELELNGVNFQGPGAWRYVVTSTGTANWAQNRWRRIIGTFTALANLDTGSNPNGAFVLEDSDLSLVNIFARTGAATDDFGTDHLFLGNRLTVSGFGIIITNTNRFLFANNIIQHNQGGTGQIFITWAPTGGGLGPLSDCTVTGNYYNGSSGGDNNTQFFRGGGGSSGAGTIRNVAVTGNALVGPGGTSIAVQFDRPTADCAVINGYRAWGTNVGGAGAPGVITGVEHHTLAATVDAAVASTTAPYQMVGPMAAAGTITGVEVKANENLTVSGGTYIWDVHKITNPSADGQGTTIFTTVGNRPTMTGVGAMRSTTTLPDTVAFAAGDYFAIYTDQSGTGLGTAVVGVRFTIP